MITRFDGEFSFLSNFYPSPIFLTKEIVVPTVEHAFQGLKTQDAEAQARIFQAPSPRDAKRQGRQVQLRPDWEQMKLPIMRSLLGIKFAPGAELSTKLLATHPQILVEGNNWGDMFWGMSNGQGDNWLGHLLMARRAELGEAAA
jgi:ribA/ribD-fused uncharacterized protein